MLDKTYLDMVLFIYLDNNVKATARKGERKMAEKKAVQKKSAMDLINAYVDSLIPVKAEFSHHKISIDQETEKVKGHRIFGLVYDPNAGQDRMMQFWLPVEVEHLLSKCTAGEEVKLQVKEPMDNSTFFEIADIESTKATKRTVKKRPKV